MYRVIEASYYSFSLSEYSAAYRDASSGLNPLISQLRFQDGWIRAEGWTPPPPPNKDGTPAAVPVSKLPSLQQFVEVVLSDDPDYRCPIWNFLPREPREGLELVIHPSAVKYGILSMCNTIIPYLRTVPLEGIVGKTISGVGMCQLLSVTVRSLQSYLIWVAFCTPEFRHKYSKDLIPVFANLMHSRTIIFRGLEVCPEDLVLETTRYGKLLKEVRFREVLDILESERNGEVPELISEVRSLDELKQLPISIQSLGDSVCLVRSEFKTMMSDKEGRKVVNKAISVSLIAQLAELIEASEPDLKLVEGSEISQLAMVPKIRQLLDVMNHIILMHTLLDPNSLLYELMETPQTPQFYQQQRYVLGVIGMLVEQKRFHQLQLLLDTECMERNEEGYVLRLAETTPENIGEILELKPGTEPQESELRYELGLQSVILSFSMHRKRVNSDTVNSRITDSAIEGLTSLVSRIRTAIKNTEVESPDCEVALESLDLFLRMSDFELQSDHLYPESEEVSEPTLQDLHIMRLVETHIINRNFAFGPYELPEDFALLLQDRQLCREVLNVSLRNNGYSCHHSITGGLMRNLDIGSYLKHGILCHILDPEMVMLLLLCTPKQTPALQV